MDDTTRPDQVTDALISKALIRADGGVDCPDPSLLAGIHEGSLEPDETERWMTHLADCQRCQATLGALARAEEDAQPSPAVAPSWWREQSARALRWPVRAPLAAAALIALAVWVIDPGSTPGRRPSPTARRAEPIAVPASAAPTAAATNQPLLETSRAPTRESAAQPIDEAENRLALNDTTADTANGEPQAIQTLNLPTVAAPEDVLETASRARSDSPSSAETAALFIVPVMLRSSQDAIQWRAESNGDIERTDDGGLNWRVQLTVPERVIAGAAPADDVAWMVGEQGLVLRTLDGEQWSRLNPPTDATLVAIEAADGRRAMVTTADGRQFRTVDAGTEWMLIR